MRKTVLFLALLLAACTAEKEPVVKIGEALPNIPLPPNATLISRELGTDAVQFRLKSQRDVEGVTEYYRSVLTVAPFSLVSDSKTGAGYTLYAEQKDQPSIWITVMPDSATGGSFVDIAGAKKKN